MNRRILILEDDPDTTKLMKDCLELLGCIVDTETDRKRGVARLKEGDYSGIILDITIPGIRGLEVLRQVRQGGHFECAHFVFNFTSLQLIPAYSSQSGLPPTIPLRGEAEG